MFSSDNYCIAWDLLCQTYNNKRRLISNHMNSLFNIENITRESEKSLRSTMDCINKNLKGLKALEQPVEYWDTVIIHLAVSKLDNKTSRKWKEHRNLLGEVPTLEEFFKFLRDRAEVLENDKPSKTGPHRMERTSSFVASTQSSNNEIKRKNCCVICKQDHRLFECTKFISMSLEDKNEVIWKNKLCLNCFNPGHRAFNCKAMGCKICKYKHNVLLHRNKLQHASTSSVSNNNSNVTGQSVSLGITRPDSIPLTLSLAADPAAAELARPAAGLDGCAVTRSGKPVSLSTTAEQHVLLSTALINIISELDNNNYVARALLDSGSQISIITEYFCKKLGLSCKRRDQTLNVMGIGNSKIQLVESCKFSFSSVRRDFSAELNCMIVPKITNMLPNVYVEVNELNIPGDIFDNLADCRFYEPSEVDILIGADLFWDLVTGQQMRLGKGLPILQYSKLGWLVTGPIDIRMGSKEVKCNLTTSISEQIERFWKTEEVSSQNLSFSKEEEFCEKHFVENTYRTSEGRFCVKIPFHTSPDVLGDSLCNAKLRLVNLEKRIKKQPNVKASYTEFINEYRDLNHLSEVGPPAFGCYLPHHPVLRDKSETTKLRVVFNASEKTSSGLSLNDIQMVGPVIQDDLFSIMLRFRQYKYVVTADIEKFYRQILLSDSQRHLQMILWRESENEPVKHLKLNTVTYGTASAPYLSTRCLHQLADECDDLEVRNVIKHDFLMDDLITGHDTEDGLNSLCRNITRTLDSGCFKLRKFRSNATQLLVENKINEIQSISEFKTTTSTLGLVWSPESDVIRFSVHINNKQEVTKRNVLSCIAKIFDSLGLLSIFVIKAKIIMQKLWLCKLGWDEPIGNSNKDLLILWDKFVTNVNTLTCIEFPRHVVCKEVSQIEIHMFSDASMAAYGACAYVRSLDKYGVITVRLLCAKSRVAPLKRLTIPKLELCGALLSAQLCEKVTHSLRCKIVRCVYWTDSMVVLGWLRNTSSRHLDVFVTNRANEINKLTQINDWRYVPTEQNPADFISRGVDRLSNSIYRVWWNGPEFLSLSPAHWPTVDNNSIVEIMPSVEVVQSTKVIIKQNLINFERYTSLNKLKRILAYVYRFIKNCSLKNKELRIVTRTFSVDELNESMNVLVKLSQQDSFEQEYELLTNNKLLSSKSKVLSLNPFLDRKTQVIRVGGRIQNSSLSYERKHPVLLDAKHRLSRLIFENSHNRLLHAGPQLLLSAVRENYWVINARKVARSVTNNCIICKRFRIKSIVPIMGNLPTQRLTPGTPFETTGVDLGGPYYITDRKGRGCKISKCYLGVFVCFTTKALHLEVVSDLSTEAFILSLRRFISRRSKPSSLYCDNATNFLGASNELNKLFFESKDNVKGFCADEGIKFTFIPPYAPNFGGLWEAGVKSAKFHIKRILGDRHLTYEELSTLFVQVEAILNSRPLFPMSSDPNDLHPLTPGHFLVGKPLIALPSPVLIDVPCNRLARYELLEQMRQQFWNRWQHEYLTELQHRTKWQQPGMKIRVGDMVIIKESNLPPLKWKIGRIHTLHPGMDGVNRVADVRTASGIIRRAVNRLCPLLEPAEDDELKERPSTGGGC